MRRWARHDPACNGKVALKGAEGAGNSLFGMTAVDYVMLADERKADLIEEKTFEKFVFGVWVKATDDDDNMVMVPSSPY